MEARASLTPVRVCLAVGLLSLAGGVRPCWASDEKKTETYPDGKPHLVYSVDQHGLKSGPYKELDPDGHVLVSATYAKDVLNGPYSSFFASGKTKLSAAYTSGKLSGKYRESAESGEVLVVANYKAGNLNGQRQEFSGGKVTKSEVWKDGKLAASTGLRKGKLHGWRREFVKDRIVADEFWFNGQLLIPKGPLLITQELAEIGKMPVSIVGDFPKVPDKLRDTLNAASSKALQEEGLRQLMAYRFLCDLPYQDLQVDRVYMAHAQAGSEIMKRIDKMTHKPDNPGMPDDEYRFAYQGTSKSNICSGTRAISESVVLWMDDSDASNIDRVGHRRWCLNPPMLSTGFGFDGSYSAMWSLDESRKKDPDYDAVAFPPRGLIRTDYFRNDNAWSISFNPMKYKMLDASTKVVVTPVRFDPEKVTVEEESKPLELEHFNIVDDAGIPNCVVFRPKNVSVTAWSAYMVNISGLKDLRGRDVPVEFFVGFFDKAK
jgi:hypothetical protein